MTILVIGLVLFLVASYPLLKGQAIRLIAFAPAVFLLVLFFLFKPLYDLSKLSNVLDLASLLFIACLAGGLTFLYLGITNHDPTQRASLIQIGGIILGFATGIQIGQRIPK